MFFGPLLFFALRQSGRTKPVVIGTFLGLWVFSVWLLTSADPVRESIVGFIVRDRTVYTAGFSEQAFRTITRGVPEAEVQRLLGPPYGEGWFYPPRVGPTRRASETSSRLAPPLPGDPFREHRRRDGGRTGRVPRDRHSTGDAARRGPSCARRAQGNVLAIQQDSRPGAAAASGVLRPQHRGRGDQRLEAIGMTQRYQYLVRLVHSLEGKSLWSV